MISRLTAMLIVDDPEVFASSYGPIDGKFGLYIGTLDEAPSGHKRPRDLVTSGAIYFTAEEAKSAAETIICEVRAALPETPDPNRHDATDLKDTK